jgi:hypothetical protein
MIQTVEKIYAIYPNGTESGAYVWANTYKVVYTDNSEFSVPHDEANRHYQEILEWVAEGNTITDNGGGE